MRRRIAYFVPIAAVAAAVLLRWLLDPLMGDTLPLVTLFGAVAVAVWVGGTLPAVFVCVAGYIACFYLFIAPRGILGLEQRENVVGLIAYLFTCALIIGIGEAMRSAQRKASERGEVLHVTLGSIGDAVITTNNDGGVTYLNGIAESLTGWKDAQARGKPLETVFRIVNEVTREPAPSPVARALSEGTVVGLANHTLLISRDGVERPIDDSAAPIRDEAGSVSGAVLIFRDVSERRRLERELAGRLMSARMLASIVESSEDAVISKSLDGIIRSWNAAAERLFGHTAEQAIGRHISLVIPEERLEEEDRIITSLRAGRRIEHFETERIRRDGTRLWVSLTVSPIRDDAGNVIGASKIVRDITRQRQVDEELRKLAANLAESDRRKDVFLATLSHELRNPLAPLMHMLEVLQRGGESESTRRQAIETMERQLAQLVRLVDDLLDLNRITHDRIELRAGDVELASVIHQAVQSCQPFAESAGHRLQVILPGEPIYLHADPVRLTQVFGNLLNNSCKYTEPGGEIVVTAERHGDEAVVSVRDTGMGIPAEQLDKIFDMFMQVDRAIERAQGGLGIGLTLVKRLVKLHGGTVEARSGGEGRGSEFIVRLPVISGPRATQARPPKASTPMHARRVLVVDDNRDAADSLAMLMSIGGSETHVAHDGASAIEAAQRHRPDVILLDIGLPRVNGYDVCRHVRAQPWGRDVIIIALTGWGQDQDRRQSADAGFDGHLVKPVQYEDLTALLQGVAR